MKARRVNRERGKINQNKDGCSQQQMLKFVILQQGNVMPLSLLQILAAIENYQYSRMKILHINF